MGSDTDSRAGRAVGVERPRRGREVLRVELLRHGAAHGEPEIFREGMDVREIEPREDFPARILRAPGVFFNSGRFV